jgi:hypothetical protein
MLEKLPGDAAGAAVCLPHLLAAGALSASEQVSVVHLVRSIMAQTPPNMEASRATPTQPIKKDYPATALGLSRALTNIIAALALDQRPLVKYANGKCDQVAAGQRGEGDDYDKEGVPVLPGLLCSVVTAELVPLLQPIIFSTVTDQVFGSTAGLSQREEEQLKQLRRRMPGWWVTYRFDVQKLVSFTNYTSLSR